MQYAFERQEEISKGGKKTMIQKIEEEMKDEYHEKEAAGRGERYRIPENKSKKYKAKIIYEEEEDSSSQGDPSLDKDSDEFTSKKRDKKKKNDNSRHS